MFILLLQVGLVREEIDWKMHPYWTLLSIVQFTYHINRHSTSLPSPIVANHHSTSRPYSFDF